MMNKIRKPEVAGTFYTKDPEKLSKQIDELLSSSKEDKSLKGIFGIVSPHAGYAYSGHTAAVAFNYLKQKDIEKVIIISPSHREYFPGICVYEGDGYETPLGIVEVDTEAAKKLTEESRIIYRGIEGHRTEHAIEVQLPFLQKILDNFKIVPVVMGDQGKLFVDELAEKLQQIIDDKTIIIASSDCSHYYPKHIADKLDSIIEKRITDFDYENLQKDLDLRNCEACGGGPIVAMMKTSAMANKKKSIVLHRSDSGDVTGDDTEVVGYLSAAIYG